MGTRTGRRTITQLFIFIYTYLDLEPRRRPPHSKDHCVLQAACCAANKSLAFSVLASHASLRSWVLEPHLKAEANDSHEHGNLSASMEKIGDAKKKNFDEVKKRESQV